MYSVISTQIVIQSDDVHVMSPYPTIKRTDTGTVKNIKTSQ